MLETAVDCALDDGDHACILFSNDEEHRVVVSQFLAEGLEAGQRVLNITHAHSPETMRAYLRRAGADPRPCEASGQLTILRALDAYTPDGVFDPEAMVQLLKDNVDEAIADGWAGMRGSGDMSWQLEGRPGSERIVEYEAMLNRTIPGSRFRALCQYDMRKFPAKTLKAVLAAHPVAFIGTQRLENFYYTPPEEMLGEPDPKSELDRWIHNLEQRQTNEAQRRHEFIRRQRVHQLQEELAAKTRFLNAAAHQLATPLTPLALQVQYLKASDPHSPLRDHHASIEVIGRGFARLQGVVGQLLEAVRANDASLRLQRTNADVAELARQSTQAFVAWAHEAGIELAHDIPAEAVADIDRQRIMQVLDNLLSNAMHVTPPGGTVTLRMRSQGEGWEVTVSDTGPGLDPQQINGLFQPFSQVHESNDVTQGTGLGLFISRNIVTQHGGRIWAASQGPGHGSVVGFWIPRDAAAEAALHDGASIASR